MNKILPALLLLCIAASQVSAQSLKQVSLTRIDFGPGPNQIGLERGAGEHWKPLFFAVDGEGLIHIPDFYKQRIAVFDKQGRLKADIPCAAGISPRMNFFALAPNGCYITFNDGTLYTISAQGKVKWEYALGPGVIPERIFPADTAIFIVLPAYIDADGRAIIFDYNNSRPLGRFGIQNKGKGLALIQNTSGIPHTLSLKAMGTVAKEDHAYQTDEDAALLYITKDGTSVWKRKLDAGETILVYSAAGKQVYRAGIHYPDGVSGTGFWTWVDEDLTIYKNYFFDDYMQVAGYRFSGK
jgi:hypothetical protein